MQELAMLRMSVDTGIADIRHCELYSTDAVGQSPIARYHDNSHFWWSHRESSRSHSVFTCSVESKTTDANGITNILHARLNLVDLAGVAQLKPDVQG